LKLSIAWLIVAILNVNVADGEEVDCFQKVTVNHNLFRNELIVDQNIVRRLEPTFFGFNIEWMGFQWSLWDKDLKQTKSEIIDFLRFFPGAIYRFPGGSISNSMDWRDTVGPLAQRPIKPFVSYTKPFKSEFGLNEYLNFVNTVNGKPWYVVNLYGNEHGQKPLLFLQEEAIALANYVNQANGSLTKIYRWELGNELDRSEYSWLPEKILMHSTKIAQSIKQVTTTAQFVSFLEEYNALEKKGVKSPEFNKSMAIGIQSISKDFAMHLYYDGKPGGQPIPNRLKAICNAISSVNVNQQPPSIWITEHARVPPNAWVDPNWEKNWKKTADLEAAIGVADLMISLTMMPEVKGAFIHSLHGTNGPWPLFHKANKQSFAPSVVFWALKMLRSSMLDTVIYSKTASVNQSDYDGGYDIRATVMTNSRRNAYAIWLINRSHDMSLIGLDFPALKHLNLKVTLTTLSNKSKTANNYLNTQTVTPQTTNSIMRFDATGKTNIKLLPNSISTISFSLPK
jgi:alpha-L-arabinofuranosidase